MAFKASVKGQPGVRKPLSGETKLQRPKNKMSKTFSGAATTVGPQASMLAVTKRK